MKVNSNHFQQFFSGLSWIVEICVIYSRRGLIWIGSIGDRTLSSLRAQIIFEFKVSILLNDGRASLDFEEIF